MRRFSLGAVVLIGLGISAAAEEQAQTDWSLGPAGGAPVAALDRAFSSSDGISWSAIPGQLVLGSRPVAHPVKHPIADGHDGAYGLYAADFDGDGDVDIMGTTDRSEKVIIWFSDGSDPPTWTEHVVDEAYRGGTSIHPADLDGDGDLDLVCAAQTPGNNLHWWRNEGGTPPTWSSFEIEPNLRVACNLFVADVDSDGDPDVVSTSWSNNYIAWWRNDGQPEDWDRIMIDQSLATAHSAFAFDADGDGDTDIAGTFANSGRVMVYLNEDGVGTTWTPQTVGENLGGVRYATAADIDGDGVPDLAAAAANAEVRWWRNGGENPPTWTEYQVDTSCFGGHYIAARDFSGDGAADLLVAPWVLNSIYWYRQNPADPEDWERHEIDATFAAPLTAFPGDLDGDGDLDVVGSSPELGEFAWWEITEFLPTGSLESSVIDTEAEPRSVSLRWTADEPSGTWVSVSLRSGPSPDALGPWSSPVDRPTVFLEPADRYIQYRMTLHGTPSASPVVTEFRIRWDTGHGPDAAPDLTERASS